MSASELLKPECPAHKMFLAWLGSKEPTKRQARKFLKAFPMFRG